MANLSLIPREKIDLERCCPWTEEGFKSVISLKSLFNIFQRLNFGGRWTHFTSAINRRRRIRTLPLHSLFTHIPVGQVSSSREKSILTSQLYTYVVLDAKKQKKPLRDLLLVEKQ